LYDPNSKTGVSHVSSAWGDGVYPGSFTNLTSNACISFFVGVTLGYDRGTKSISKVVGKFVELGIAVDLNSLLGRVADNVTVVAPGKMIFQFGLCTVIDHAVEVIGKLLQKFRAFHWLPSPGLSLDFPLAFSICTFKSQLGSRLSPLEEPA
jgi:hypothetical protein